MALVADFTYRMAPSGLDRPAPSAVVFTGQFNRIQHGLSLLAARQVQRLFISGVNPGAGLTPERFISLFAPDAPGLSMALNGGRLELGLLAADTFGNAHETACWYRRAGLSGPLVLITSRAHMPRASVALAAHLPEIEILRAPVEAPGTVQTWMREFPRYLATRALLLAPRQRKNTCPTR